MSTPPAIGPTTGQLVDLRARVGRALTELRRLRCTDRAAIPAVHTVKLTEQTLACWWLPLFDDLIPGPGPEPPSKPPPEGRGRRRQ